MEWKSFSKLQHLYHFHTISFTDPHSSVIQSQSLKLFFYFLFYLTYHFLFIFIVLY